MANPCDVSSDGALVADAILSGVATTASEAGLFADDLLSGVKTTITDAALVSSAAPEHFTTPVTETALLADAISDHTVAVDLTEETARLADQLLSRSVDTVTETALVHDALATEVIKSLDAETAAISDTLTGAQQLTDVSAETAILADRLVDHPYDVVTETAILGDALSGFAHAVSLVSETALVADALFGGSIVYALFSEAAVLSDSISSHTTAQDLVNDGAIVSDLLLGDGRGIAWTANLDTMAMSRYSNFRFNSLAEVDGFPLALGDDGAYLLTGDDDAGTSIDWSVRGDLTDAIDTDQGPRSAPNMRRPLYLYAGYQGQMTVVVGETSGGAEAEYRYDAPTNAATMGARTPLGHGIRSRYLRLSFENKGGAAINLNDASVLYTLLQRRI